jgi:hypothetical protein
VDAHKAHPDRVGISRQETKSRLRFIESVVVDAAIDALTRRGVLECEGDVLRVPTHRAHLGDEGARASGRVLSHLHKAGLAVPRPGELEKDLGSLPDRAATAESICDGIREVIGRREELAKEIDAFRQTRRQEWDERLAELEAAIAHPEANGHRHGEEDQAGGSTEEQVEGAR